MAKLKWGLIGGGEGSQIGPAHRLGSGLDALFEFTAGALDHRPEEGRDYAQRLGLQKDRATVAGKKCWMVKRATKTALIWSQSPHQTQPILKLQNPF